MPYQYQVSKPNEQPELAEITKTGGEVVFTVAEVKAGLAKLHQMRREMESKWRIAVATKKNIEYTHPHIAKMSPKDLVAAFLFREQIGIETEASAKLQEIKDAIDYEETALKETIAQTGLAVTLDEVADA